MLNRYEQFEPNIYFSPDQIGGSAVHEQPPSHEILVPLFGVATVSGRSGTGKTTTSEIIAKMLGITNVFKVGRDLRDRFSKEVQGAIFRELSEDEAMDAAQAELMRQASIDNPVILEGRLAGIIKGEIIDELPKDVPIVSILFTAPNAERFKRISKREKKSQRRAALETKEREAYDLNNWTVLHPQLKIIDPFNPANKDIHGRKIYNIVISTMNKSQEEVALEAIEKLIEMGLVEKRTAPVPKPVQTSVETSQMVSQGFYM